MEIKKYFHDMLGTVSGLPLVRRPYIVSLFLVFAVMTACDDRDEAYKEYIKDGETIYLGKAHSVQAAPGNNRLKLSWWLTADPQVVSAKVFWNDRRDSLEIPIDNNGEPQELSVLIDDLEERIYSFEIFTYDNRGNRSLRVEALGEAFGDTYTNGLVNRVLGNIELVDGKIYLSWEALPGNSQIGTPVGVELHYTDLAGNEKQLKIEMTEAETVLSDIKLGSELRYRTMFLPDPLAIDTFYSTIVLRDIPRYALLDKMKFKKVVLPTDNVTQYAANNPMENLWDNSVGSFFYTAANSGVPTWFTFDLGQTNKLGRFRYNQRNSPESVRWGNSNPRYFEIWGTADTPDADGSWDGWTKLMEVESVKPSGLPIGEHTEEDIDVLLSGEEFDFPADIPAVRYLRIKVNSTWGNTQSVHIAELTFWGE
ncbi:MAG TPA: DUF4998 domain-containing protein [Parapedobacter sp.]|uniref:DUF4998 domain-containing protein n=1 Tax=Parapedobacter sp. TaxID=1958893 RepID=UPI002C515E0D|nr:DUF4998 domain-containing protein [Parapedobacter sp.]HWK57715.1 DUF4998 domain-containing protein [Parapedobacter sp.]